MSYVIASPANVGENANICGARNDDNYPFNRGSIALPCSVLWIASRSTG